MSEKKILRFPKTISALFAITLLTFCSTKKQTQPLASDPSLEKSEVTLNDTMEAPQKIDKNGINAKLECQGNSKIAVLQLAEKKYDTEDFECLIVKGKELKIQFTSASKAMEIIFTLYGVEDFNIQKGDYLCQSSGNLKYASVILNAKSLGNHNFGDTYEGKISIIDYGMSSNVICGNFQLKDRKGNLIEGTFNEIIQSF